VWWALYEGCSRVGVTIHQMTAGVDTGPILAQTALEVGPDPDAVAVWRELGELARPLLTETLEQIRETGGISGRPQPEGGSYRGSPYTKEAHRLELDWSQPAEELARRNRILRGNIPAGRWRVYAKRIDPAGPTDRPPGTVLRRRPKSIQVAVGGQSSVKVTLVDPAKSWIKLALGYASTGRLRTVGSGQTA